MPHRVSFWIGVFALLLASAFAQEFRGTINGRVSDATGSGIPNAKVTVKNIATNEQTVVATTAAGDYAAPFLIPGKYTVTAEAPGFKEEIRDSVEVRVNEKVTANFEM